jgi:hypothetical protein
MSGHQLSARGRRIDGRLWSFAEAAIKSLDLVIRLTQRSFVYHGAVYILDPNLRPLAPPLIRFGNGVAEIVGKYFGDVFFALNFDFPGHMRSPLVYWSLRSLASHRPLSSVEVFGRTG